MHEKYVDVHEPTDAFWTLGQHMTMLLRHSPILVVEKRSSAERTARRFGLFPP